LSRCSSSACFRDTDGAAEWCDIAPSTADENCTEIARLALDDALQELVERYGADVESWRWGAAHEAHHDHQVLGDTALLSWIVNIRQPTSAAISRCSAPHPRRRARAVFQHPCGGLPGCLRFRRSRQFGLHHRRRGSRAIRLSRHYDDLGELWRRGEYIPMTLDPDLARAGNLGVCPFAGRWLGINAAQPDEHGPNAHAPHL
jgi:penicillin amidase